MKSFATLIAPLVIFSTTAVAQGLDGSSVDGTLLFPTVGDVVAGPINATVGPGVEFPAGSFVPGRLFVTDISANRITYLPGEGTKYGGTAFNGFKYEFSGAPAILSVSLDASSTLTPASVSWDSRTVLMNLSGLEVTASDQIVLSVSTVPEPASWLMLAAGGVAVALRRQRAKLKR